MGFRVSGFDKFSLFERILQINTEFAEKFGGDTFLPFSKCFLGFLGLTSFRFSREFGSLTQNSLRNLAVTYFHHLTQNRFLKYRRRWKVGKINNIRIDTFVPRQTDLTVRLGLKWRSDSDTEQKRWKN